jgi:NADH:ubiquinone oxidoreductase subunit 6 (subunit J)
LIRMLFLVISSLGLLMALGTVLARNLVHAALFLVGFFFIIACQYVLLEAEFLAVIQVLIYIGAVAVLLLFGIMLTRNIQGDETTTVRLATKLPAVLAGVGVFAVLAYGIRDQQGLQGRLSWTQLTDRPSAAVSSDPNNPASVRAVAINDMGRTIGYEMMTRYVVAFELAGLLLTAALVGAIALAQLEGAEVPQKGRPGVLAEPNAPTNGEPSQAQPLATTAALSPSSEPR